MLGLPQAVCEYEDVFSNKLPRLPTLGDVDFTIELHPGISHISMTPYRMASTELQELKVQLQKLLDRVFVKSSTSPLGHPNAVCQEEGQDPSVMHRLQAIE